MQNDIRWPEGKRFAFTIFDDTDNITVEAGRAVYDFLADYGFRTTKSVWPIKGPRTPYIGGLTCEDPAYLKWVMELKRAGFEIGLHNVTYHTADRKETIRGLKRFEELFGAAPKVHANHAGCDESIYWGPKRLSPTLVVPYHIATRFRNIGRFGGAAPDSPMFWGDLCREKIKYVRNFVYRGINTLRACPMMPYHDPKRPFVNYWFASSDGANVHLFDRLVSEENQDALEGQGGCCVVYTHFASGFYTKEGLDPGFKSLMKRLSKKAGWFVPVSEVLDFLLVRDGSSGHLLTSFDREKLQWRWFFSKLRRSY